MRTIPLGFGLLLLSACKSAPELARETIAPSVAQEDFLVATQSLTQVDIKYTGLVAAGSQAITVEKAAWEFVVDGAVKRSGEAKLGLTAPAEQQVEFTLAEGLAYVKDEEELKAMDARGGSLLLAMRGTLFITIAGPATGEKHSAPQTVELPFAKSKEVRTPRLPHLKMLEFEAGRFSETEVQAVFHLGVVNSNPFQISLAGLDYAVQLAGKEVTKGIIGEGERVSAASTGVFDVTATLNEDTHGKDAAKLVKGLNIPFALNATLRAQLYSEALNSRGEIKLRAAK